MRTDSSMDKNQKVKYFTLILLAVVFWSTAYPVIRYLALAESNPYLVAFYRTFFSMVIFLFILLLMRKPPSFVHLAANWPVLLGMSLTGVVFFFLALTIGLQYVAAGKSSLINSINPALIVILAHFIFHESLCRQRITGLIFSLVGVLLVITGNDLGFWYHLSFQSADLIFVFSGLCWASYSLLNRFLGNNIDPMEGLFWVFALAVVFLSPLAFIYKEDLMLFPVQGWFWMFYLGLVPSAIGNYFWYKGIVEVGAANTGLINSFLPFFSVLISYFTLGEILTPMQFIGAAILVFGVWLGLYKDQPREKLIGK